MTMVGQQNDLCLPVRFEPLALSAFRNVPSQHLHISGPCSRQLDKRTPSNDTLTTMKPRFQAIIAQTVICS